MKLKPHLLLIGTSVVLPLCLGLWARSAASWRLQKIGTYSSASFFSIPSLIEDRKHGPWIECGDENTFNVENGDQTVVPVVPKRIRPIRFSPNGLAFVQLVDVNHDEPAAPLSLARPKYVIEVRECASGQVVRRIDKFMGGYSPIDVQFSPSGESLLLLMQNGVETYPLAGSKPSFLSLPLPKYPKNDTLFSHTMKSLSTDGKWACSTSDYVGEKQINVYSTQTGRLNHTIHHGRRYTKEVQFSPDGSLLWVRDIEGDVEGKGEAISAGTWICDVRSGAKLWDTDSEIQFSPDGRTVVIFSSAPNSAIELRNARSGKRLRAIQLPHQHTGLNFGGASFSSDGSYIYAFDGDGNLWKIRVR